MRLTTEFRLSGREGREGGSEDVDEAFVADPFVFADAMFADADGVLVGAPADNAD